MGDDDRYRALFEALETGFCIIEMKFDPAGRPVDYKLVELNPAFERQTGLSNAAGRWVSEAVPGLEAHWFETYGRVAMTGESVRFESFAAPFGRWYDVHAFRAGRPEEQRVCVLFNDVTAGKKSAAALVESETRFRNLADHAPVMMWVTEADGRCAYLNRAWYAFTGQTPDEAEGFGWLDAVHPDDRARSERAFLAANADRSPFRLEYRLRRADGAYRWAIDAASPRFDADGSFVGYVGSVLDIDERYELEARHRAQAEELQAVLDAVPAAIWIARDPDCEVISGNARSYELLRMPADINQSKSAGDAPTSHFRVLDAHGQELTPDDLPVQRAARGETIRGFEERLAFEDGSFVDLFGNATPLRDGAGAVRGAVAAFVDISDRKTIERELRSLNDSLQARVDAALAEKRLFAELVEGTDAFVQVADQDFRWLAVNKAAADEFERAYGVRPAVGQSMLDALAHLPDHQVAVRQMWERALAGEQFTEIGEFGGTDRRHYEIKFNTLRTPDGRRIGAYQFVYDVTARIAEQHRLADTEEQLRQAQKMEAMGQLTGGVAHDFNNLLTPIVGALDLLQRRGVGGEREQRLIAGAMQSADRARTLVQRLLAFARRQPIQVSPVDIGSLVREMAGLIESTTGPKVQVVVSALEDLPCALADPNQIEMAILNLSVNARDAMPEGGVLHLRADSARVTSGHAAGLHPGLYVRLSVSDTGVGMDEATLQRAIEPFFSTKGVGKGTGLGLSMVHGLASQLGGALTIRSSLGAGTEIDLWLPASDAGPGEPAPERASRDNLRSRGLALLVDDEDLARLSTADMLADLGYDVHEAVSAEDALERLAAGLRPDILVTDHLMPGLTGVELAGRARERVPDLQVLIVSGYAELDGVPATLPRLSKPFIQAELAASLSRLEAR